MSSELTRDVIIMMSVRYVCCFTIICLVITIESTCICALNLTTVETVNVLGETPVQLINFSKRTRIQSGLLFLILLI